jgi:hypothetical protein
LAAEQYNSVLKTMKLRRFISGKRKKWKITINNFTNHQRVFHLLITGPVLPSVRPVIQLLFEGGNSSFALIELSTGSKRILKLVMVLM